jgi:putative ABC transport system permease protein
LSLLLLAGASLMIRTLFAMERVELGFRADRLLTLRIPLPEKRYPDPVRRAAFLEDLLRQVQSVPGVVAAAVNTGMHPLGNMTAPVEVVGSSAPDTRRVLIHQISPDYLRVVGIRLLQGRSFTPTEQSVAVVNESFVKRHFPTSEPLGRLVKVARVREQPFQIVGIVQDTRNNQLIREVWPEIYIPYTVTGLADRLGVLTSGPPAALAPAIRAQVYEVDKDQPVTEVRTMAAILDEYVFAEPRFNLVLFSAFAALGLTLAVIGVYGVMSHSVVQQTQEIGVRLALGAQLRDIAGMVVWRGLRLLLIGIALGLTASFAATRLLARQIWNVSPVDPLSFAAVSMLLLLVGLLACYWPARRASRVDPMTALRYE